MFGDDYTVREAKERDLDTIMRIEKASFPKYPYPPEVFEELLRRYPKYFLVAEYKGEISGYTCGRIMGEMLGEIVSLGVEPNSRRRGIARRLVLELESRFSRNSIENVRLQVSVENNAAIKLYRSIGYRAVELLKRYYPDGSDAFIMVKVLNR